MRINNFFINNGVLILKNPIICFKQLTKELAEIQCFKSKLLKFYKNFYKLKFLFEDDRLFSIMYHDLIKKSFKFSDFNLKRKIFLSQKLHPDDVPLEPKNLSENELEKRILNTLVCVFNSTVKKDMINHNSNDYQISINDLTKKKRFFFNKDYISENSDFFEKSLITTIIEMHYSMPPNIKYDYKYNWLNNLNKKINDYKTINNGNNNNIKLEINYLAFKQYYITIMRLNESMIFCF